MNPAGIAALVPAAGYSTRMGTCKPLIEIGGTSLVELAVNCFLRAGVRNVTVILGDNADAIIPLVRDLGVNWVLNDRYESGMLSLVLKGVSSFDPGVRAFFMLPCDIPLVKPETIRALIQTYRRCPSPVIYPVFRGRRGHPPLISMDAIRDLTPEYEGGMRSFLRRFAGRALEVEVADEAILLDCDTPEDRLALLKYALPAGPEVHKCGQRTAGMD